jgi:choline-sulfatase
LTELPLGRVTLWAYAAVMGGSLVSALVLRWSFERPGPRRWLRQIPGWQATAATAVLLGAAAVLSDTVILPGGLPRLHLTCLVLALLGFSLAASLVTWHAPLSRLAVVAAMAALLLAAPGWVAQPSVRRLALQTPPTLHTQLLDRARLLLDRDGDGFSAVLDGGDCDDHDASVYPLSLHGRDCLGWIPAGRPAGPAPVRLAAPVPATGPPIVVLVTVDALRCNFGQGTGDVGDLCPRIAGLGGQGRVRLDMHTPYPNTESAVRALHLGDESSKGPALASLLADAGYRSHAVITHRALVRVPAIRASFHSLDETLVPASTNSSASTAEQATDHALAWLRQEGNAGPESPRLFLWVHYYDPHDPYVATPGNLFVLSKRENYFAEVRRTDAEVGRLADALGSLARARDVLMLITADHGEAFGEHGRDHHYTSVHEESVRIPFVAWSPGGDPRRYVSAPLPADLFNVRPFLMALIGGAPFEPTAEVMIGTDFADDTQVGILIGGWKLIHHTRLNYDELYDLGADPGERDDRAARQPARVTELGRRLGARLLAEQPPPREPLPTAAAYQGR